MDKRINHIMALFAELQAEFLLLIAADEEEDRPDLIVPDFEGAEYGPDGLAVGERGGFLVKGIAELRREIYDSGSDHAASALDHPNLMSEFLLPLSAVRLTQLRDSNPEIYVDYIQNVVLGRVIIPGGGNRGQQINRGLTFRQALDFNAIGSGHVGHLNGVLVDQFARSADDLLSKLRAWWADWSVNGPIAEPTVPESTGLPQGTGRIDPVVYKLSKSVAATRTGRTYDDIFSSGQAYIGVKKGQYVEIQITKNFRVGMQWDGFPAVVTHYSRLGRKRARYSLSGVSFNFSAGDRLRIEPQDHGGWLLVTPQGAQ